MENESQNTHALNVEKILKDILAEVRALRSNSQSWMTIDQLSSYIGLRTSTLYQYVNQGRIPFHKIPGSSKLIFSRQEIDVWIMNAKAPTNNSSCNAKEIAEEIWSNIAS